MNNRPLTNDLRQFLSESSLNLSKLAYEIGVNKKTLSDFLHKTYQTKQGETKRVGLGANYTKVLEVCTKYGFKPTNEK